MVAEEFLHGADVAPIFRFGLEEATVSSTASELKKRVTSAAPSSAGRGLP